MNRRLRHTLGVVDESSDSGWALATTDGKVDTGTAAGRAHINMMATFAEYERELIGERTRDGLAAKRASVSGWADRERSPTRCYCGFLLQPLRSFAPGDRPGGFPFRQRDWIAADLNDRARARDQGSAAGMAALAIRSASATTWAIKAVGGAARSSAWAWIVTSLPRTECTRPASLPLA